MGKGRWGTRVRRRYFCTGLSRDGTMRCTIKGKELTAARAEPKGGKNLLCVLGERSGCCMKGLNLEQTG